jgi:hypothetical protein
VHFSGDRKRLLSHQYRCSISAQHSPEQQSEDQTVAADTYLVTVVPLFIAT